MMFRRTVTVPWDDLDDRFCGDEGRPDWTTLIVTGPTRRAGLRGTATLEWTVTVQCRPADQPIGRENGSDRRAS
jgi:hypothetical protein